MSSQIVAQRMADIPFAGIRHVFDKAAKLEASGVQVIHFEIGRPDFDTPDHIKKAAVEALAKGMVHYTPNAGIMPLRKAIAASIEKYKGIGYDPSTEIMATAGGQHAMYLSLEAILNPGDEILVPDPGYSQFYSSIQLTGGVAVPLPLLADRNFMPDLKKAEQLATKKTRAIIVNSPHNPTGAVLTPGQIETLCRFADEHGLLVFSDEAYDRITYEGSEVISPAAVPGMKDKTVIWGSLSKTYSMTGWRLGYLAAPEEVVAAAIKIQQNLMLSICSFAQAGAVAALNGPQDCVAAMVAEFDQRRRVVLEGIGRAPGLTCPAIPLGAFYVFVRHQVAGMDANALTDYLLEQAGVATVPGLPFGPSGKDYLRISYATSLQNCEKGMQRIVDAMSALADHK